MIEDIIVRIFKSYKLFVTIKEWATAPSTILVRTYPFYGSGFQIIEGTVAHSFMVPINL